MREGGDKRLVFLSRERSRTEMAPKWTTRFEESIPVVFWFFGGFFVAQLSSGTSERQIHHGSSQRRGLQGDDMFRRHYVKP